MTEKPRSKLCRWVRHRWRSAVRPDGTTYRRCIRCGKDELDLLAEQVDHRPYGFGGGDGNA